MTKRPWWKAVAETVGMRGLVYSVLAVSVGALLGLGIFTFGYANGFAYFGNNPQTCASCHAMNTQYEGWKKGPHHAVAGCNDCHAPHDNMLHKYVNKADNGFWHSLKMTTQNYPVNIQIRDVNRKVTEHACLDCHADLTEHISMTRGDDGKDQISCIRCHRDVGH